MCPSVRRVYYLWLHVFDNLTNPVVLPELQVNIIISSGVIFS